MPQLDGVSTTKQIREFEELNKLQKIIIIGSTGYTSDEDIKSFIENGMN